MLSLLGNKITKQLDRAPASGKVVALMNQKGGVGKTTMAFNVAHALSKAGKKVLVIDMDPQFNLSSLFEIDQNEIQGNIFHLLINSIKELKALHTDLLLSDVLFHRGEIDVIPSGQELSGFELTVAGINSPRQLILKKFIEKNDLNRMYDFIVIDGPPTLGLIVVNILCAAGGVLFPFIPDAFSEQGLKNIHQTMADVEDMGISEIPKIVGYVPNLFEQRRKQARHNFSHITSEIGEGRVFEPFVNKASFARLVANRKSVFDYEAAEFKSLQGQFNEVATHIMEILG